MNDIASLSVRRPVLAMVMSFIIILLGVLSYSRLGVREFPSVTPAVVSVTTQYPGASAEVIEQQITEPLETEINTIDGIDTLTSTSREGRSTITVEFRLDVDLDRAANDVRDRASRARGRLPPDAEPPVVQKADAEGRPVVYIKVTSESLNILEITEIADNRIKERVQTIPGVASTQLWGSDTYSMRLWMNPKLMSAYEVTAQDVRDAVNQQNVELPAGIVDGDTIELDVKAPARINTPEQFEQMIVKRDGDSLVRFGDLGYATYGSIERREKLRGDGDPMVMTVLRPKPGANQIQIADMAKKRLNKIKENLPSEITAEFAFDSTEYIRRSIDEVQQTIFIALMIVIGVIFFFLGDWRTTLIPVLVIPVSIIGAFAVMSFAGFSINVLTLLALVLALGIVVDDSIVVLENVFTKIEEGKDAKRAGIVGTREIFFAVVATTLSLVVVFIPILYMGGTTGRLFTEFGVVLAGAVLLSSFAALTLAPMLCSKLLINRDQKPWFRRKVDPFLDGMARIYRRELAAFLEKRWLAFVILIGTVASSYFLFNQLSSELAPKEDRGELRIFATAPQGRNYAYMDAYMRRTIRMIQREVPERELLMSMTSPSFGSTGSVNSGFHFISLGKQSTRERSQNEIAQKLSKEFSKITGAKAYVSQPATISDDFGGLPVQFVLQNMNIDKIREVLPDFMERVQKHEAFKFAEVNLKFNKPELNVQILRDRAKAMGVPVRRVAETLELALTTLRVGFFIKNQKQYDIIAQVPREARNEPTDFRQFEVRNNDGKLISLADLVEVDESAGAPLLFRFNRYSSATVSAQLADGYTIGDGVGVMNQIADDLLDDSFSTSLKGQTREFAESSRGLYFAFGLALLLVYFVLSAQFESFRESLTILLTVPLAISGALFALWYFGQTLNVFSQIGMIMLIGLVTKNGILIVEFANQRRADGLPMMEAIKEAAEVRFRPVLMTSISTSLGILPIALALGAGAESRVPMGISVIGGMIVGSFLTLFVVPAIYTYIARSEMTPEQKRAAKVEGKDLEGTDGELE